MQRAHRSRCATRRGGNLFVQRTANEKAGSDAAAKGSTGSIVGNRERQAALVSYNAADGPAAEELIIPEVARRRGQVVEIADDQPLRTIEIASRLVLLRVGLKVVDVRSILSRARGIQLVGALRTTDIVDCFRESISRLKVHPVA